VKNIYPKPEAPFAGKDVPGVRNGNFSGIAGTPPESAASGKPAAELSGLFCLLCAALLLASLISFSAADPGPNHVVYGKTQVHNLAGMFGAYLSALFIDLFGFSSCIAVLFFAVAGARLILRLPSWPWWRWTGFLFLWMTLAAVSSMWGLGLGDIRSGGLLGDFLRDLSLRFLNPLGSGFVWLFALLAVLQLLCGFSWRQLALRGAGKARVFLEESERRALTVAPSRQEEPLTEAEAGYEPPATEAGEAAPASENGGDKNEGNALSGEENLPPCLTGLEELVLGGRSDGMDRPVDPVEPSGCIGNEFADAPSPRGAAPVPTASFPAAQNGSAQFKFPPVNLLRPAPTRNAATTRAELEEKGRALMTCLHNFGIRAELVRISPGPVVTSFEVRPAPGVKSSSITVRNDDIALSLKAVAVRIQAPVPGTDTIGIEIPNDAREVVGMRELLEARHLMQNGSEPLLGIALGKDIAGRPAFADLAKMPHMLVAGATGAGKSVFLNTALLSFLFRAGPQELKLLLIDPKRVEMAVYSDLPHLIHPIVVEPALARNALEWAVTEMERRYEGIRLLGVRNMQAYNQKLLESGPVRPPELAGLAPMPYLVIVIDELADLILSSRKEVETSLVRLAQLARAAGMHIIVATQHPSVDVVTGLIKANFPCRISFQVSSKMDSRVILDAMGAERLLGRGDMLFKPAGGALQRLHGAFVPDEEVNLVADYWRGQGKPDYQVDFSEWGAEDEAHPGTGTSGTGDGLYLEIIEFVRQQGKVSISLIQRRFSIGFNKAARYVEQMEQDGIIGPANGSKPREVM
jgi:S-DNA-T family DNA segregation ATPase FtsK/SpoIIIE